MAAVALTFADFRAGESGSPSSGTAGEAIGGNKFIYYDSGQAKWYLASNADPAKASATAFSVSVADANGDKVYYLTDGAKVKFSSAALTANKFYELDANGAMQLANENTSGEYGCLVAFATSTTEMTLSFASTGVAT